MKKLFIVTVVILMVAMAGMAVAATATNNLAVSASVSSSCRITSVGDISFGAYDPTTGTATDAAGNMVFQCVKNTSYKTYITGTRSMSGGGDTLNFQLYSDAGRTTAYPGDNSGGGTTAANGSAITKDIYGRIAALQDVGAASYTATLVATVEY